MRRNSILLALAGLPIALFLGWRLLGYPYSLDEANFLHRASAQISSGANALNLAELMPGDWELVCESHGYEGPMYLERYDKTFEPVSRFQDAAWGLIFISADGSYRTAAGSCSPGGVRFSTNGCIERAEATFVREPEKDGCTNFTGKVRGATL